MSHEYGKARFADGTIFHFEYDGTADVVCSALRLSDVEVAEHWREDNTAKCTCGKPSEPVRLMTFFGSGWSWDGKACRSCMAVTDGLRPLDTDEDIINEEDGVPEWAMVADTLKPPCTESADSLKTA